MQVEFKAYELRADGYLSLASYQFHGTESEGWEIIRNGERHLDLGPGYRLLQTEICGVCSTDLDRVFLPFPLPQVIGHEVVARDESGQRYAVEINASHRARNVETDCAFCNRGLERHCPDRIVLGIHDLPGGFGPFILAPVGSAISLPTDLDLDTAVLIEPFAAALNAVTSIEINSGDTVAVLGPRRLGLLVIAALRAYQEVNDLDFEILALARRKSLLDLAADAGATRGLVVEGHGENLDGPLADVVIDTTANPEALELAFRIAGREVHLKSTHGQPSAGASHLTELVVDEISVARLPAEDPGADGSFSDLISGTGSDRPRVFWMPSREAPQWLKSTCDIYSGKSAERQLDDWTSSPENREFPQADAAVVQSAAQVDEVLRPVQGREISLVRPRGVILFHPTDTDKSKLLAKEIADRGLRLSSSRCGDFHQALELMRRDPKLMDLGKMIVTHRFPSGEARSAFKTARSIDCIKAVIRHSPG